MENSTTVRPVLEARCDWITCTAERGERGDRLAYVAAANAIGEHQAGDKIQDWTFQGYAGQQAGSWRWGKGRLGTCVVVSGQQAEAAAWTLARMADHWSRVDYCVTAKLEIPDPTPDRDWYERFSDGRARNPHSTAITRIQKLHGGATLAIGERSSACYIRCYDKHKESLSEYPPGAWRYEVEYKRHLSESQHTVWKQAEPSGRSAINIVWSELRKYDLPVPFDKTQKVEREPQIKPSRDADRLLSWLQRCVAPSVCFCVEARGREAVHQALGLTGYSLVEREA